MNRTIKFRAWDIKRNRWLDEFQVMPNGTVRYRLPVEESPDRLEWQEMKDIILLQFTGVHDKNGKEIYEGDILHEYREKTAPMANNEINRKLIVNDMRLLEFRNNFCEVIGNIYENPELLKA